MRTIQSFTCELGYGADTMFHRTYFLFPIYYSFKEELHDISLPVSVRSCTFNNTSEGGRSWL